MASSGWLVSTVTLGVWPVVVKGPAPRRPLAGSRRGSVISLGRTCLPTCATSFCPSGAMVFVEAGRCRPAYSALPPPEPAL